MERKKTDRRIRKTEKQLLEGLTVLMETKSINDITVRELTESVDINRSTFYLHYQDIYDMIEHTEDKLLQQFTRILGEPEMAAGCIGTSEKEEHFKEIMVSIFEFLKENKTVCRAFLGSNGDIRFLSKVTSIISDRIYMMIIPYVSTKYSDADIELVRNYFVSGCMGLARSWLNSDDNAGDPYHMAELFISLVKTSSGFII